MRWDDQFNKVVVNVLSKVMSVNQATGEPGYVTAGDLASFVQNIFAGVASPDTDPTINIGTPKSFLAMEAGTYVNFFEKGTVPYTNIEVLPGEFVILLYDGSLTEIAWSKTSVPYEAGYQVWESAPENAGKTLADYIAWIGRMTGLTELADAVETATAKAGEALTSKNYASVFAAAASADRILAQTAKTASETAQGITEAAEAQTCITEIQGARKATGTNL